MKYTPDSRVGRWTLLAKAPGTPSRWQCKCDCGTLKVVRQDHLSSGQTRSCGCARAELHSKQIGLALLPQGRA